MGKPTGAKKAFLKGAKAGRSGKVSSGNVASLVKKAAKGQQTKAQKSTITKTRTGAPRKHKAGAREIMRSDDIYNARRRYRRQAERFQAKARESTGITRARYEAQARNSIMNAMMTYQGGKARGRVATIASELGVTQESLVVRAGLRGAQAGRSQRLSESQVSRLVQKSMSALAGKGEPDEDRMAREILSVDNIGSRFYGGLIDVWGTDEESRRHPNQAILEYFGADNLMQVLEELEDAGIDIYTPNLNDDQYKSVQLKIQEYVQSHKA